MQSKVKDGRIPVFKKRFGELAKRYETRAAFADAIGLSRQSVNFWLNGERVPDAENLISVCSKLGVSSDWLLGLSDVKAPNADMQAVCKYTGLEEEAVAALRMLTRDRDKTWIGLHCLLMNDIPQLMSLFAQIPDYIEARNSIPEYIPGDMKSLAAKEVSEEKADGKEYRLSKSFIKLFAKGVKD